MTRAGGHSPVTAGFARGRVDTFSGMAFPSLGGPRPRAAIPALSDSRGPSCVGMLVESWMRWSLQSNRPSARICSCLSSSKTMLTSRCRSNPRSESIDGRTFASTPATNSTAVADSLGPNDESSPAAGAVKSSYRVLPPRGSSAGVSPSPSESPGDSTQRAPLS